MRYLLFVVLIAAIPLFGFAQSDRFKSGDGDDVKFFGIPADQTLAVGLGVLGGAIGLQLILGGGSATLVGALAGALVGNWWYEQRSPEEGPMTAVNYYTAR